MGETIFFSPEMKEPMLCRLVEGMRQRRYRHSQICHCWFPIAVDKSLGV